MAFRVLLDPLAVTDIDETTLYIAERGDPERALAWKSGVYKAIRALRVSPLSCVMVPEAERLGVEYRQIRYHSHRIVFLVDEEERTVYVARVYHSARRALRISDLG